MRALRGKKFIPGAAFSLAELLIALAILAVLATFTIPKILQNQQNEQYNSAAKEAIGTISQAFWNYKADGRLTANTTVSNLMQYVNYVNYTTVGTVDSTVAAPNSLSCASGCYRMHGGGTILAGGGAFTGTSALHCIMFWYDGGGISSPGRSVLFIVYYNGKVTSYKYGDSGSINNSGVISAPANYDPDWFHW